MFRELGSQIRKENIRKVQILTRNLCRSPLGNQAGYLKPSRKVDIEGRNRSLFGNQAGYLRSSGRVDIKGRNMNHVSPMFRIECCSGELLLTY